MMKIKEKNSLMKGEMKKLKKDRKKAKHY